MNAGRASGRALLARTPSDAAAIEEGDILVVPALSADFAVAFTRAGGVVAERGGPLSNGATLAREAGTPTVVLQGAMLLLGPCDIVTIDGALGDVKVGCVR